MIDSLVSVIIPTFKREKEMIIRAVESVLSQTYQKFEVIIVDDSPSDFSGSADTKDYVTTLNDSRIKLIRHSGNKGANVARNTGIKSATGEFIAFLDDDDEWLPDKLSLQLTKFKDSQTGLVYGSYYSMQNGKINLRKTRFEKGDIFEKLLFENFIGSTSCVLIRNKCIETVGMFDENLPASQDYDLYLRIAEKYYVDYVEEPLIIYHEHAGERISGNPIKKLESRKSIYNKFKKEIIRNPKLNSKKHLLLAYSYADLGERRSKWKHWFIAVKVYPRPSLDLLKSIKKIWLNS